MRRMTWLEPLTNLYEGVCTSVLLSSQISTPFTRDSQFHSSNNLHIYEKEYYAYTGPTIKAIEALQPEYTTRLRPQGHQILQDGRAIVKGSCLGSPFQFNSHSPFLFHIRDRNLHEGLQVWKTRTTLLLLVPYGTTSCHLRPRNRSRRPYQVSLVTLQERIDVSISIVKKKFLPDGNVSFAHNH